MFNQLPVVTKNILIINILMFLGCEAIPALQEPLTGYYFESESFRIWQVLTHMFMHGGIGHLFMNMFGVYMFGALLESYWGAKKFLNYYLICGLGAFGLHQFISYIEIHHLMSQLPLELVDEVLTNGRQALLESKNFVDPGAAKLNLAMNVGLVGASGCLFGLLIAYGMLFPNSELMLLFLPFPIKARYFVIGYGVIELLLALADRQGDNVAHYAHIGGMLIGYVILKYWQKQGRLYS
jgi:membrane associated rhomboid family serine protease